MAGSVNQATGLPDFEDVLRTGAHLGQDFQPACVCTNPREGVVGPKLLAEGPKTRSLQWDQFLSKRGGPKSYPAVFRATLGTSLLLWLCC